MRLRDLPDNLGELSAQQLIDYAKTHMSDQIDPWEDPVEWFLHAYGNKYLIEDSNGPMVPPWGGRCVPSRTDTHDYRALQGLTLTHFKRNNSSMDRQIANAISDRVRDVLRKAAETDPLLKKYNFAGPTGSFDTFSFRAKIEFTPKEVAAPATASMGLELTDEAVRNGLAKPGTPILYGGGKTGIITDVRRVKYAFIADDNGKGYIIRFNACRLDTARLAKMKADATKVAV